MVVEQAVDLVLRHKNGQEFTGFQIIAEEGEFLSLPPGVQKNTRHCSLDGRITHTNKVCIVESYFFLQELLQQNNDQWFLHN